MGANVALGITIDILTFAVPALFVARGIGFLGRGLTRSYRASDRARTATRRAHYNQGVFVPGGPPARPWLSRSEQRAHRRVAADEIRAGSVQVAAGGAGIVCGELALTGLQLSPVGTAIDAVDYFTECVL